MKNKLLSIALSIFLLGATTLSLENSKTLKQSGTITTTGIDWPIAPY